MKTILDTIIEARNGHYCHAFEATYAYELESIADSICDEFLESHGKQAVIDFLSSASVYFLENDEHIGATNEELENALYAFSFATYIG